MILCAGEALIDLLPTQSVDGRAAFISVPGGSVFNTAIALGRLGANVALHAKISSDTHGQQLITNLEESNVNIKALMASKLPSALAMVHLKNGHASYGFYDDGTAAQDFSDEEKSRLPSKLSFAFFGGISLIGRRSGPYLHRLIMRLSGCVPIMIDPNIRPNLIEDEKSFRANFNELFRHADIIKVSDEDLAWLAGVDSYDSYLDRLLDFGVKIVLITKGKDGITAVCHDHKQIDVAAVPTNVIDTVGAGDTFNAGFLCSLQENSLMKSIGNLTAEDLKNAMELGAKAASVTVSRSGANPPWRLEISP